MTRLLEQALTEVKRLPEGEQDAIATLILEELADERRWQESFARSQDQLARLAAKVREDIQAGRAWSGGFTTLSWKAKRTSETRMVEDLLRRHFEQAECYRYNAACIRVRVLDPRFEGMAREKRDSMVEQYLNQLAPETHRDIVTLFTFAPSEVERTPTTFREYMLNTEKPAADASEREPIFKWETMNEMGTATLSYGEPVQGKMFEVELTNGPKVRVFRADDGEFYFCHGLTFGGKHAPGGPVSPFSGKDVRTILDNHYQPVLPESGAIPGDILVWKGLEDDTPHSAILTESVALEVKDLLGYSSKVQTKNGRLPETEMTLERLTGDEFPYGDSFNVYRRK